jgi:hypothetical protein
MMDVADFASVSLRAFAMELLSRSLVPIVCRDETQPFGQLSIA